MRAVVHDPSAPAGLALSEVPRPRPGPSQALIRVAAVSLNYADVAHLDDRYPPGAVPGLGTPNDIAHAAMFLMTNPQVTGAVLEVTGGESLVDSVEGTS